MKLWSYEGKTLTDTNSLFDVWDGAHYVMLENDDDMKIIHKILKKTGYRKLWRMETDGAGLYKRGACDEYERIAPVLE